MFPVGTAAFYCRPTFTSFQVHEYFRGPGRSSLFETSLLVEEMLDEFVLITWSSMDLDVLENQKWCVENFSMVGCLFIGTMSVVDADSVDESEALVVCALVYNRPDLKCDGY
ncbi:hypothetical protein BGAL_0464g00060 [Botrytis galanthina]|uniref:Uncharacterized protein n=1 Tax=Botrytis galanthina TaxID=278940 RepID=A0A4S8QQV7_9HELO|nr:hypothetical protein BGAL_0464g00060 [Botrytis galanthina]